MGGGFAKRVLLAPAVIAVAITVVPPTTAAFSPLSHWLTKSVPPTLATVTALDGWVTNGLPPRETTDSVAKKAEDETTAAASAPAPSAATAPSPAQGNPNISETPEHPAVSAAPATEKPILASLGRSDSMDEPAKSATVSLLPDELEIADADTPGQPVAEEKQAIATVTTPAAQAETATNPAAAPVQESKTTGIVEEAKIAAVAESKASVAAEELKVPVAIKQAEDKQASADFEVATTGEAASNDGMNLPAAKQFPATPAFERHASLGPAVRGERQNTVTETTFVPPEKVRVAYDAPAAVEEPMSIGKRRYVDDTTYSGRGSPEALLEALRHMGANAKALGLPAELWCADFMNLVLRKSGLNATGSRAARSYLDYGQKIKEPRVGAIAIFTRGPNGGHIGIVRGTDGNGNPIIVSGNHNNRVAEAVYPKDRVLAYVVPYDKPR